MSDRKAMLEESREAKDSRDRLRQDGFVREILAPTDLTSDAKKAVNYAGARRCLPRPRCAGVLLNQTG